MGFTRFAVKIAAPSPKPISFSRYLFIGPHPDDLEIGAGASIAKLSSLGKEICILIATDGRYGTDNLKEPIAPETLIEIRKKETITAARKLGVTDVRFLDLSDGGFYDYDTLVSGIASVVSDFQPDMIFAPDPDVTSECHEDHKNVGRAAKKCAVISGNAGIMAELGLRSACKTPFKKASVQAIALYMTAKPNRFINTSGFLKTQLSAIFDCHKSQYPDGCPDIDSITLYLKLRAYEYGIRTFSRTAEGFRVLGRTEMHCLPEAGC